MSTRDTRSQEEVEQDVAALIGEDPTRSHGPLYADPWFYMFLAGMIAPVILFIWATH